MKIRSGARASGLTLTRRDRAVLTVRSVVRPPVPDLGYGIGPYGSGGYGR